jgi:ESCRT-II complex subunit VPS22
LRKQFDTFKSGLEAFAETHRRQIDNNPALRTHFTKMCLEIGVDPLRCKLCVCVCVCILAFNLSFSFLFWVASKGFWAETLGIGDFYYELAVQVIDICFTTRDQNGGLIELRVLLERLERARGKQSTKIEE